MTDAPLATVQTVSHVALDVADLSASIAFYQRVLGLVIAVDARDEVPPNIKGVVGDFVIEIAELPDSPEVPGLAHRRREMPGLWLSLAVRDAAACFDRMKAAGLTEAPEPRRLNGATFFSIRDPDGFLIELIDLPGGARSLSELVVAHLDRTKDSTTP